MKKKKRRHTWVYQFTMRDGSGLWERGYKCDLCGDCYREQFIRYKDDPTDGDWQLSQAPAHHDCTVPA